MTTSKAKPKKAAPYNELKSLKGDLSYYATSIQSHKRNLEQARAQVEESEKQLIANQGAQQAIQRRIERLEKMTEKK